MRFLFFALLFVWLTGCSSTPNYVANGLAEDYLVSPVSEGMSEALLEVANGGDVNQVIFPSPYLGSYNPDPIYLRSLAFKRSVAAVFELAHINNMEVHCVVGCDQKVINNIDPVTRIFRLDNTAPVGLDEFKRKPFYKDKVYVSIIAGTLKKGSPYKHGLFKSSFFTEKNSWFFIFSENLLGDVEIKMHSQLGVVPSAWSGDLSYTYKGIKQLSDTIYSARGFISYRSKQGLLFFNSKTYLIKNGEVLGEIYKIN